MFLNIKCWPPGHEVESLLCSESTPDVRNQKKGKTLPSLLFRKGGGREGTYEGREDRCFLGSRCTLRLACGVCRSPDCREKGAAALVCGSSDCRAEGAAASVDQHPSSSSVSSVAVALPPSPSGSRWVGGDKSGKVKCPILCDGASSATDCDIK